MTLDINCEGLSQKRIAGLADELSMAFRDVEVDGERISASDPLGKHCVTAAYELLERYGVSDVRVGGTTWTS